MRRSPRPSTMALLAVLAVLVLAAAVGPWLWPADPLTQDIELRLRAPSRAHPFGTDGFGRDVLSRTLSGMQTTFLIAFLALAGASVLGIGAGTLSALAGGLVDAGVQRIADIVLAFPSVVLSIVVVVALGTSPAAIAVAITIGLTPRLARVARASTLVVRDADHVVAARSLGVSGFALVLRHLLPDIRRPLLSAASSGFGIAIATEATLSFLGLGVPPPYPSLGRMLQEGSRQYFEAAPWVTIFPGLVIALSTVCLMLLADKLAGCKTAS